MAYKTDAAKAKHRYQMVYKENRKNPVGGTVILQLVFSYSVRVEHTDTHTLLVNTRIQQRLPNLNVTALMKSDISLRTSGRLPDDQVDAERRRAEDQPDYRQEVEPPVAFTKRRKEVRQIQKTTSTKRRLSMGKKEPQIQINLNCFKNTNHNIFICRGN